jgi:predicted short-subunit dehydrogenase-like oxidoreductase (DUF2520 family)
MNIVLIGSGNVASVLGRKTTAAGHRILQVFSPQIAHAVSLAEELNATPVSIFSQLEREAEITILAIRDESIAECVRQIGYLKSTLVHTAGAIPMRVLFPASETTGVLYPLQSVRKEIKQLPPVSFLIEGNSKSTLEKIRSFAQTLSDTVVEADSQARLKYHLAATLVNNFTNYLFTSAADYCEKENISFRVLQPLIEETVSRLRNYPPQAVQTGPAFRNDVETLQNHRMLLQPHPGLLHLYDFFTQEIRRFAKEELNP